MPTTLRNVECCNADWVFASSKKNVSLAENIQRAATHKATHQHDVLVSKANCIRWYVHRLIELTTAMPQVLKTKQQVAELSSTRYNVSLSSPE